MAPADPITLDAEFSDHAQRTAFECRDSRRLSAVGNGMPIRNPAGAISRTVITIRNGSGSATPAWVIGPLTNARIAIKAAIERSAGCRRSAEPAIRPRLK